MSRSRFRPRNTGLGPTTQDEPKVGATGDVAGGIIYHLLGSWSLAHVELGFPARPTNSTSPRKQRYDASVNPDQLSMKPGAFPADSL